MQHPTKEQLQIIENTLNRLRPPVVRWQGFCEDVGRHAGVLVKDLINQSAKHEAFNRHRERILYSASLFIADALNHPEKEPDGGVAFLLGSCRQMGLMFNWGMDRVVGLFSPDDIVSLVTGDEWWREYATDYLYTNFSPWSVYVSLDGLSDRDGRQSPFVGFYAGFECGANGEPVLYVQHVTNSRMLLPEFYHQYDFKTGKTLGEVYDTYAYNVPGQEYLAEIMHRDKELDISRFDIMMRKCGRNIAKVAFPLLITMFSDEAQMSAVDFDRKKGTFHQAPKHLPMRSIEPSEAEVQAAVNDPLIHMYEFRLKPHADRTIN